MKLKQIVTIGLLCVSLTAIAQHRGGYNHEHNNALPIIGGLIVGAAIANAVSQQPVYINPQPVYVTPSQPIYIPEPIVYPQQTVENCFVYTRRDEQRRCFRDTEIREAVARYHQDVAAINYKYSR